MRQVSTTLALLFVAFLQPQAQEKAQTHARLFHRSEKGVSRYRLEESLIDLADDARKPGATIAVRICSKESIQKALFFSPIYPQAVYDYMSNSYSYSRERIRILRSNDCLSNETIFSATELWVIPEHGVAPPSVESMNLCQLRSESIPLADKIRSARGFKNALKGLIKVLHKPPQEVGIISGYYFKKPAPSMVQSLRAAQTILNQSGLAVDRYAVRLLPWHDELPANIREPKYPMVVTVAIAEDCRPLK